MRKIRVLLVDDHTLVRQGMRRLLETDPEVEVVGEAGDGNSAIRLVQEQLPLNGRAIDVGAHIGMSTVPMARAVGPSGRVDALEPCRPNSRPCDVQLSPMVLIQRLRL